MTHCEIARHALLAMSAKPFHKMHFELIKQAMRDNDQLSVFVGTGEDTSRGDSADECVVSGNSMFTLWNEELTPALKHLFGDRIDIFPSRQPIRGLFAKMTQILREQESGERPSTFISIVIGDESEKTRYTSIEKMKNGLSPKTSQEKLISTYRHCVDLKVRNAVSSENQFGRQANEISATRMRQLLAKIINGSSEAAKEFKDNLPEFLSSEIKERILTKLINDACSC